MKIEPKRFTSRPVLQKGEEANSRARKLNFTALARFNLTGRSLVGRVKVQKPTKADQKITKKAQSITRAVPTPFNT